MYSLAKFASRTGRIGKPLPAPFGVFDLEGVRFRRGGTSLLAGQPGSFKSVLALNMLCRWSGMGQTAVYFSADSDEFTVARRCAGIITDIGQSAVEAGIYADFLHMGPMYEALGGLRAVRFEYKVSERGLTPVEFMAGRLAGFEQVNGDYPDVVFVDNLINYSESATDWGLMIDMIRDLDEMARETRSHICILHHASDGWPSGKPVPRAAIQGKVTQIPRLVLTTAADGTHLIVSCVKNTNGPQYPNADHWVDFIVRPSLRVEENEKGYM